MFILQTLGRNKVEFPPNQIIRIIRDIIAFLKIVRSIFPHSSYGKYFKKRGIE